MSETEKTTTSHYEELIDVSEFENELTEIDPKTLVEEKYAAAKDEEELTPIRERTKKKKIKKEKKAKKEKPAKKKSYKIVEQRQGPGWRVANLRERFTAFFIDSLVLFYCYWVFAPLYCRIFLGSWSAPIPYSGWHAMAFHGSFLILAFVYYVVFEGIFLATIGKFLCWMSVRKKDGEPASLLSTFIRNIFRPLDYILIFPVIFIMELSHFSQRIGDIFARSTVIKKFGSKSKQYDIDPEMKASASGRTFAFLIDLFIFGLFIFGYVLIFSPEYSLLSQGLLLLLPLVAIGYFVALEMITETSPGKWLAGLTVCQNDGNRISFSGSIVRTIWRLFDTNPIGLLCLFLSENKQRPGDLAASTMIVKGERTSKGLLGLVVAVAIAIGTLYVGGMNKNNVFSKDFKWNFLPKLSFINQMGFEVPEFDALTVDHFRFAAGSPDNIRTPPTFKAGETVYMVFELLGYTKRERSVWLQEDLAVRYPNGKIGLMQSNIVDYKEVVKGHGPIELTNNISLPENAVGGNYEVLISVRDRFAGTETKRTKRFFVRRKLSNIIEKDVLDEAIKEEPEPIENEVKEPPVIETEKHETGETPNPPAGSTPVE